MKPAWRKAADYAGIEFSPARADLMHRYGAWLADEGQRAGGIGPAEPDRIDRRHLADSLLFASLIPDSAQVIWDLGSGSGLPGVPLAIAMPDREFVLIDRSGRRADLLRRVVRILDLRNCEVVQGEITDLSGLADVIVSRASLPPPELASTVAGRLDDEGVVICAGSWVEPPEYEDWDTVEIPRYVLDQPVWLLMMRRE